MNELFTIFLITLLFVSVTFIPALIMDKLRPRKIRKEIKEIKEFLDKLENREEPYDDEWLQNQFIYYPEVKKVSYNSGGLGRDETCKIVLRDGAYFTGRGFSCTENSLKKYIEYMEKKYKKTNNK